ncbi:MAG: M23 family metallopeptidase [Prolixibacteraceae bacterium]|jgi:hypothetical protein|nr:M23 family metallopeptidase [Prolixibacteraceae bacterium]
MYRIPIAISLLFLVLNGANGQAKNGSGYQTPLNIPISFSGGFGELRKNHFHTGLDFRTSGQIGLPVFATREGSIVRISVSPTGYGHALYLLHPDGHTTVYGHLSRFNPAIESYVVDEQYRLQQFAVDLKISSGLFSCKKGEIIAFSGNSGSSGGPHLHFEIRDTQSEKPQNPLFYLSNIHDKSAPRMKALYLYPLTAKSSVNKCAYKQRIETISKGQTSSINVKQPIEVYGEIGVGLQAEDDFNGTGLKWGIYSAELFLDKEPAFSFKFDHLVFEQGRYVNSHIDYEELIKGKRWIHRLYLLPGNKMEIYQSNSNRGFLSMTDGKYHTVKIILADAFGNSNTLSFKLLSKKFQVSETNQTATKFFPYDQSNQFENVEVKVNIPEGALYDNLPFKYHSEPKTGRYFSKIQGIHYPYIPLHKPYLLSIKTNGIPTNLQNKALVVLVEPKGGLSTIGGAYENGWLTATPRFFGNFTVVLDTISPKIEALSIKDNKTLLNKQKIEFKITDNLSGIFSYEGKIDGNWVLFEYDAKTSTLFYSIDKKRIVTGKLHKLQLTVTDERNNAAVYKAGFFF